MTRFDIITIFPGFFSGPLDYGIVRRAREASLIEAHIHDLRDFTHDRHKTVDDRPFGGGEGMVMKPEPLFEAVESLLGGPIDVLEQRVPATTAIVLLSAAGKLFRQEMAERFARLERILLICGRYEGVDERVAEHLATDEVSVGDFVLSGGELAAAMVMDATVRLIPGALGNEDSTINESFSRISERAEFSGSGEPGQAALGRNTDFTGHQSLVYPEAATGEGRATRRCLLDFPHYTRPASFRGWDVPEILLSGNHEEIRRWRSQKALEKTMRNRPDLSAETERGR
ncbi:MAG: tRNA (guanosine(37)-N1)-methyltransferase TrmD [Candidatus Acidiferrales bacterium]